MQLDERLRVEPDGWRLVETGWDADRAVAVGSNFLVGNGYLGYRATSPEQGSDGYVGLVVTDTYDCADGRWRELCTVPNPLFVSAAVAGTPVGVDTGAEVEMALDLRMGRFDERLRQLVGDAAVEVRVARLASMDELHLLAQRWELTADRPVEVAVLEGIDGEVWSLNGDHFADMAFAAGGDGLLAEATTGERGTRIAVAQRSAISGARLLATGEVAEPRRSLRRHRLHLEPGAVLRVDTVAVVVTSNDDGVDDPVAAASARAERALAAGVDAVTEASRAAWATVWAAMDVEVEGDVVDQTALRFCAYHNRICTPAHSDRLPIGARGLSCQAYQGAAFWDQEIFNLPAFVLTEPDLARNLLVYRHRTLDGARGKAARLGYDGAYYAWVSGDTGDELCPDHFFVDVLTGRPIRNHFNVWQMHVSPDIATSVARYVEITGDEAFLVDHGAEIAFEVARFLRSFVRYDDWTGTYHCIRLLGPDEWHENVDDNAFTNHQTAAALGFALDTHARLAERHPAALDALRRRLDLTDDELAAWARIRDTLVLPGPDPDTGLIEQFRGFFELEDVGPDEVRSRLLHPHEYWGWPNGVAVATQVSKQADVVMLLWLHAHRFSDDVARANYEYYEPRCSHGSTLSHPAHGMVAARIGDLDAAHAHFRATATVDLLSRAHAIVGGTFIGGIHTAACGGAYQLAVFGFGGLDVVDGALTIEPRLPSGWTALTYPVAWRGHRLRVRADHDVVSIEAGRDNPGPIAIRVRGQDVTVAPGASVRVGR